MKIWIFSIVICFIGCKKTSEINLAIGQAYFRRDSLAQAEHHFIQAMKSDTDLAEPYHMLGMVKIELKDYVSAEKYFIHAVHKFEASKETVADNSNFIELLSTSYEMVGLSHGLAKKALLLDTINDNSEIVVRTFTEALVSLEKAAEVNPRNESAKENIKLYKEIIDGYR